MREQFLYSLLTHGSSVSFFCVRLCGFIILSYLCSSIKSRSLRLTHQPSIGCHGGQGTMRKNSINFKNILNMETNRINPYFAAKFLTASIQELVEYFNSSVNNHGQTSIRAVYDQLLIHEFMRRGIDVSTVHQGKTTNFTRTVAYDKENNKLMIAEPKVDGQSESQGK